MMDAVLRDPRPSRGDQRLHRRDERNDMTLEWLRQSGYQQLLDSTVLVINHTERGKPTSRCPRPSSNGRAKSLRAHRRAAVRSAHPRGQRDHPGIAEQESQRRYLEIAAMLADMFPRPWASRRPVSTHRPARSTSPATQPVPAEEVSMATTSSAIALSRVAIWYQDTKSIWRYPPGRQSATTSTTSSTHSATKSTSRPAAAASGRCPARPALQPSSSLPTRAWPTGRSSSCGWCLTERYRPVIEDVVDAVAAAAPSRPPSTRRSAPRRLAALVAGGLALCAAQWRLWAVNGYSWRRPSAGSSGRWWP
ncbi:transcriptional regulator, Fis family domain protein [Mycobacterium xenopi 4042]|uniref:Transcriptional regulator, Fis family domain protein n=1 Tax=Mycobacterium xenopi 4042 TaxID=1299334 RepID=X8A069_MYCXE|nr:transcriptional regulator, Fis family domain protein [Mycobacterium xenopi 4042]